MIAYPASLQRLIRELSKLPSIGEKSATRLAYHIINNDRPTAHSLAKALVESAAAVTFCEQCFFLCEGTRCAICADPARENSILCVVEKPADVIAFERIGEFKGQYHVLHGVWAPLRGQGPESMKLAELLARVKQGGVREVILGTSSTVEGDATALYLARALSDLGVVTTRLAQGIQKGGELEYADELTLSRAFQGRSAIR